MDSVGATIFCKACGKAWEMDELGVLHADDGETEFSHIPDWFEWERSQVKEQIEAGEYFFEDKVDVHSLPRCMKFEHLGEAILTHSLEGFKIKGHYNGEDYEVCRTAESMYGVHVEYDYCYVKPCDCVDISIENDNYFFFPKNRTYVVTKLAFATEIIYDRHLAAKQAEMRAPARKETAPAPTTERSAV